MHETLRRDHEPSSCELRSPKHPARATDKAQTTRGFDDVPTRLSRAYADCALHVIHFDATAARNLSLSRDIGRPAFHFAALCADIPRARMELRK